MLKITVLALLVYIALSSVGFSTKIYCTGLCSTHLANGVGTTDCSISDPKICNIYDSNFLLTATTSIAGFTPIQIAVQNQLPTNGWKVGSNNINNTLPMVCNVTTFIAGNTVINLTYTYTYNFYSQLVSGDYVTRTYTLPNHYFLKIKYTIAFIGVWSNQDYLNFTYNDTFNSTTQLIPYNCTVTDFICPSNITNIRYGNQVDCLNYYFLDIPHNASSVTLNFTSITGITNKFQQFWLLYDIITLVSPCHAKCVSCYGPTATQCTACASNFYLAGNTCISAPCPIAVLPSVQNPLTGTCVSTCPVGYYLLGNVCTACMTGCMVCLNGTICTRSNLLYEQSLWTKYITIWVVCIIIFVLLIISIIWKFCFVSREFGPARNVASKIQVSKQVVVEDHVTINDNLFDNFQEQHIKKIDMDDNQILQIKPRKRNRQQKDKIKIKGVPQ